MISPDQYSSATIAQLLGPHTLTGHTKRLAQAVETNIPVAGAALRPSTVTPLDSEWYTSACFRLTRTLVVLLREEAPGVIERDVTSVRDAYATSNDRSQQY